MNKILTEEEVRDIAEKFITHLDAPMQAAIQKVRIEMHPAGDASFSIEWRFGRRLFEHRSVFVTSDYDRSAITLDERLRRAAKLAQQELHEMFKEHWNIDNLNWVVETRTPTKI